MKLHLKITKLLVMESMNDFWSMNEGTFACLHDRKRTNAFRRAIKKTVMKNDVVVELGAGSGVLSMFAADAGARKVYAIELDHGNVVSLRKSILKNGYTEIIEVIEGDAAHIDFPEKPDVVICEMIATGLIEELQVPAMNNILRFAKKDSRILLEKYLISIELVHSKNEFFNKKFDVVRFELPEMRDMKSSLYSEKKLIKTVNFKKINRNTLVNERCDLEVIKSGRMNAVRLTGETYFSSGEKFKNSTSYSFPMILPVDEIDVTKGDTIRVQMNYRMCEGPSHLKYKVFKI
jgi:predicted RNA methylase